MSSLELSDLDRGLREDDKLMMENVSDGGLSLMTEYSRFTIGAGDEVGVNHAAEVVTGTTTSTILTLATVTSFYMLPDTVSGH